MKIEVIEVETKLHVLAMSFSNSYFSCIHDHYQIVFTNSNIVEEMETLHLLSTKLDKKKPTTAISKDRALLDAILESYTYLITVYKSLANITMLSPKYKRYDMVKFLTDWCKASAHTDVKVLVKEVVREVVEPEKSPVKLSRQEQIELLAGQLSSENKLKLYKKVSKK